MLRNPKKGDSLNMLINSYPSVEESLKLLSKKWRIAPEVFELHLNKRDDVVDTTVNIHEVVFHIPTLTRDNLYVVWKCLWPDCHNCCERQDGIPLTKDDVIILAKKLDYKSKIEFLKNETLVSSWTHREAFGCVNTTRTQITLKRKKDETDNDNGTIISCRFLDDKGCGIHPDKPGVCWMYPFVSYIDYSTNLQPVIHALFQFTGDYPGFYVQKSLDTFLPVLEQYSKKIYDYNMAYCRTKRESFGLATSVALNTSIPASRDDLKELE